MQCKEKGDPWKKEPRERKYGSENWDLRMDVDVDVVQNMVLKKTKEWYREGACIKHVRTSVFIFMSFSQ